MSDENPNQTTQSSQPATTPSTSPTVATPSQQTSNPAPSKEDPFALDPGLIGPLQKGGGKPEQTAVQKPEIIRRVPLEKKQG